MERLTIEYCGEYAPRELCSIDRLGGADDCDLCCEYCKATEEGNENCGGCAINKCFNKLGEYENLEEQNKLLKLPCKAWDVVYGANKYDKIVPMEVMQVNVTIWSSKTVIRVICWDKYNGQKVVYDDGDFGERIFFSEEEIKERLEIERRRFGDMHLK